MPHRKHIAQAEFAHGKVLDIGYAEFLNKHIPNLYGIDISPAPENLPSTYVETKQVDMNTQGIPYPDGFFDTVIANDVIEHLTNPIWMLCESNRVLKPGGILIVSTPNPYYYWEFMQNWLVKFKFMKAVQEGHFTTFTRINMRTILTRNGFRLDKELGNFFSLIILKWTFFLKRFPFLTYQITYIATKVGEPQQYVLSKPTGKAIQKVPTSFGVAK